MNSATLMRYAERGDCGFGGGADGRTGIPMNELVADLAAWPEWRDAVAELAPRVRACATEAPAILDAIPDDWLAVSRKRFAARMLALRVTVRVKVDSAMTAIDHLQVI